MTTLEELKKWYNNKNIDIKIDPDFHIIKEIYTNDNNNHILENIKDCSSNIYLAIGLYFKYKNKNNHEMERYYLLAIKKGNIFAMNSYACYLENIKNFSKMEKYYLIAIKRGNIYAMYNYALYLEDIKNFNKMEKYYLMAIENGDTNAMVHYARYLEDIKDFSKMEKYYLMAIEKGNTCAMNDYARYLEDIKDFSKMEKYYLMAIEKNDTLSLYNYALYLREAKNLQDMERYLLMILMDKIHVTKHGQVLDILVDHYLKINNYTKLFEILINHDQRRINTIFNRINFENFEIGDKILNLFQQKLNIENINIPILKAFVKLLKEKINLVELHFKYSVNGLGYEQAKNDFFKKLNNN